MRRSLLFSSLVFCLVGTAARAQPTEPINGFDAGTEIEPMDAGSMVGDAGVPLSIRRADGSMPAFDPQTIATIKGTITAIDRARKDQLGVRLEVNTGKETIVVNAGPSSYLDEQMIFGVKDVIEVRGSRVQAANTAMLIATRITRWGRTVEVRRDDGSGLFQAQR